MLQYIGLVGFLFLFNIGCVSAQQLSFDIDPEHTVQEIANIGAAGCWFSEDIGRYWKAERKERIAELLFSQEVDKTGNPKGIGLSAWRFNIGGGTAEQGEASGIEKKHMRVEGFLSDDGGYDWSKQKGYRWFLRKAKDYGVKDLIAFSNTPPVQFTKNGLGFKLEKDYTTNLRKDKVGDYATFLTEVVKHFQEEGIPFSYISPINEPQWDWSGEMGKMKQEGSPWQNEDIYQVASALDSTLSAEDLDTKILLTEAAMLTYLYGGKGSANRQISAFFDADSPYYLGKKKHVPQTIAGHSYFTDDGDSTIVAVRKQVKEEAQRHGIQYWQSEYSMLGDGYREGKSGKIPAMDCALFLAKIIHHDFVVGNATAWQLWNAYEPGSASVDTRYYLIALDENFNNSEGDFQETKNLWALGHFSRFVRPGMSRVETSTDAEHYAAQDVMLSAYLDEQGEMVFVLINYSQESRRVKLNVKGNKEAKKLTHYITSAKPNDNMRYQQLGSLDDLVLPPRSIHTITASF